MARSGPLLTEKTLEHEGGAVREFYTTLAGPVRVGIEATGAMQWFLEWMEELGIECRVGDPAKIRAAEPRKQKNHRRDAQLLLKLLSDNPFPAIWMPSSEICGYCCATVISGCACESDDTQKHMFCTLDRASSPVYNKPLRQFRSDRTNRIYQHLSKPQNCATQS